MLCMSSYVSLQSEMDIILRCGGLIQRFLLVSLITLYTVEWPQGQKELNTLVLLL